MPQKRIAAVVPSSQIGAGTYFAAAGNAIGTDSSFAPPRQSYGYNSLSNNVSAFFPKYRLTN